MRPAPTAALLFLSSALPLAASSPDAWETFRAEVAAACSALVAETGRLAIEVNPFGSDSYGAALVTLTTTAGTDRMICIYDKTGKRAELTAPFGT